MVVAQTSLEFIMIRSKALAVVTSVAALTIILVSCGGSDDSGSGSAGPSAMLKYIPADSPYVFVVEDKLHDDVYDKLEPHLDLILDEYHNVLEVLIEEGIANSESDDDAESLQQAAAFIRELNPLFSVAGLDAVGINRDSRMSFFGQGLLPVFRLTLSDGSLLEAEFARLEESTGKEMDTAMVDGVTYRYAGDEEWRVILAIVEDELVITAAGTEFTDEQMKTVLGLVLPTRNIGDEGTLGEISEKYDYDDFMVGLIDVERIVATFLNEPTGINAAVLEDLEFDASEFDDVCRSEIQSLAGILPRMVTGYTEINTDVIRSNAVMELRDDIAQGISGLTGSVPGLGGAFDGMASFGMSFDLAALRQFYSDRLDALEANPFECELFAEQQAGIEAGREMLNQPIPPIVYGFQGFLAEIESLDGMDLNYGIPPTEVDVRMLVATENAEGLLAMGAMFVPEIAALNLEVGGDPVKVDVAQVAAMGQTVYAALSDNALALSVGDGMQDGLKAMLAADSISPSPFMSFDVDAETYYRFTTMGSQSNGDDGVSEELQDAINAMMLAPQQMFDRFHVDVLFTEDGVKFASETMLSE